MSKWVSAIAVFVLGMGLSTQSVGSTREGSPEATASEQAQSWLALVDRGQYEESWNASAKLFRTAVTRDKWKDTIAAVRDPLGKVISRRLKSAPFKEALPGAPDGKYVVIQFETSFEKKKAAVETITPMQEPDGAWRVSGYFIK